ncbi:helix-turn-helix domain-containing protein [Comamonas thiooxydans]|uniref:YdaS family helix-turn-helix protein n=1 Tax=Comamonas thiooxydans TaxID=363952 RepID=UPI000B3527DB|nr:YdaS family helix-turn-helix protein [Comamonas thiooxydans]BDR08705.1 helix-turn-helix domain-containing protein [Comamonas thiooxydans]
MSVKALIDKAIEQAGSQAKLAEMMGVKQQHISAWKTGVRTCTMPTRIQLCEITGYDLKTALLEQVIEGLDESDETQKGAKEMIQAMLDAFPNRS